jgi:3-oxoacyl-[acyl-carrier-protein] synthase III
MIGIHNIGSYIPLSIIDNRDRCHQFNKDEAFIREKTGFIKLPRKDKNMETSDMCMTAYEALNRKTNIDLKDIDCILVCTQNPDGYGLPHTSAIVHEKLGLPPTVAAFDVSLGCSGYIYSLNILSNFMEGNNMRNGLLFTADPYSKVLDPDDYVTELLFGDAATCSLISDKPVYAFGNTLFGTDGSKHNAINVDAETRRLSMDGRDVFKFTMRVVPEHILNCIQINNLTLESIDLFLLHQASKYIVENISKKLDLATEKVPFHASELGNTVSSTLPILLEDYIKGGPALILICGFGVGLSWASTILKRL